MKSPSEQWQDFMAATGCTRATIETRTDSIRALMNHAGVNSELDLTRAHVVAFLARDRAQWTKVTYWKSVKALSGFLKEFDLDPNSDLVKGVARPKNPEAVARPIDNATIGRLLAEPMTARTKSYVLLALYQALRVHEIAKIRGEDFDLGSGWLRVYGKGKSLKSIPIHPEISAIAESMAEFGYWFPSIRNPAEHVRPEAVSATITAALHQVGSRATAHQLRDTAATQMQRQFRDLRVTQSMLRHRDIKSTAKYVAVADEDLQRAVRTLDWGPTAA